MIKFKMSKFDSVFFPRLQIDVIIQIPSANICQYSNTVCKKMSVFKYRRIRQLCVTESRVVPLRTQPRPGQSPRSLPLK